MFKYTNLSAMYPKLNKLGNFKFVLLTITENSKYQNFVFSAAFILLIFLMLQNIIYSKIFKLYVTIRIVPVLFLQNKKITIKV